MKRLTAAQQKYVDACSACRDWALSATPEILSAAEADRVARSYGIKAPDASSILAKARLERSL